MTSLRFLFVCVLMSVMGSCLGDYPLYEQICKENCLSIDWITIPAGTFEMGSNDGSYYEQPIHLVNLKSFQMSKTEVTIVQYRACVNAGICSEQDCNRDDPNDHPVSCIDWGQARTFAKWVGADLPTEAEWEYAARGGQGFVYAGSEEPDDIAWYGSNSGGETQPVGTKRPNGYGLHDMSGNVWEWVLDEYRSSYDGAPIDGHQHVGSIPMCSTKCDNSVARRMIRGGSWYYDAVPLRVTSRNHGSPDNRRRDLGLRLRRTLP